jgi:hypothetical protein
VDGEGVRWRALLVVAIALAALGAFAASYWLGASADDLLQMAAAPKLEDHVGEAIELEGRDKGPALRHGGPPIEGKAARWVRLSDGRRIVVHTPVSLACPGVLVLHGTVLRREAVANKGPTVQLDVDSARCRRAGS